MDPFLFGLVVLLLIVLVVVMARGREEPTIVMVEDRDWRPRDDYWRYRVPFGYSPPFGRYPAPGWPPRSHPGWHPGPHPGWHPGPHTGLHSGPHLRPPYRH